MPTASTPGRSLVTRRAVIDLIRTAALGSYGVTGLGRRGLRGAIVEWFGIGPPGIQVTFDRAARDPKLAIDLYLTIAYRVPVAEVARQVDSAVRYAVRMALGIEVDRLTIHVEGLRYQPGSLPAPPPAADPTAIPIDDLAASGTDVA